MSGPPIAQRTLDMVDAYVAGASCQAIADRFGVTRQCVSIHVKRHAPQYLRPRWHKYPAAGPAGDKIYMTRCSQCDVAIGFYKPPVPEMCSVCREAAQKHQRRNT